MPAISECSVLVTGATGTVGQELVRVLVDCGANVRVMSRYSDRAASLWPKHNIDIRRGDLLQPGLEEICAGIDVVFHLASYQPGPDVLDAESGAEHRQVTVDGTAALLTAASGVSAFIFVSSVRAGDGSHSDYALAKREAEQRVLAAGTTKRRVSVLRLPPVYGDVGVGMIPTIVRSIDRGRFRRLPDFGERRSLVHRNDVAQALLLMACDVAVDGKTYTVTDGEIYSLRVIYELSCKAMGVTPQTKRSPDWLLNVLATLGDALQWVTARQMPVSRKRLAKMRADAWFDGSAIGNELGFKPRFTLQKILPELVAEIRRSADLPVD